ncbi:MAG: flagellar assembly protein FliH [Gammaproteobacteria bacterium]|nr:flagellar assembly protein FliH [Gammaproteobacteria bacterium]
MSRLIRNAAAATHVAWKAPDVSSAGGSDGARRNGDGDLNALQQRAWQQGLEEGRAAGIEAGTRELAARITAVERVLDALARPLEDLDHRVEEELLALVQAVVRQLIRREVHIDPKHIIGVIREGLAALPLAAGDITVRLHPDDAEVVRSCLTENAADRAWRIEADPLTERGGCLITSARSTIDARLETRLARVIAALLEDERAHAG